MPSATIRAIAQAPSAGDFAAARRVFKFAGEAIKSLDKVLDAGFTTAVDALLQVKGRVIVSGIGKSGHIARKIAATFASTGTPALFVHPAEASHGDLGAVTRDDALLMMSWRGQSPELSDLIVHAKRLHIPLVAMGANPGSDLMKAADVPLVLPQVKEACPMGMAPTTSTTLMLVLGDALAVALMERRGFTVEQYRNYHPGGGLGRAMMRVADLMHKSSELPLADEAAPMAEALAVLEKHRFGCVGIVDKRGALTGIITDGDLRRNWNRDLRHALAREVMTKDPKVVRSNQLAAEALDFMSEKKITQLFVLDAKAKSKKPVGLLHIHDCLRAGLRDK